MPGSCHIFYEADTAAPMFTLQSEDWDGRICKITYVPDADVVDVYGMMYTGDYAALLAYVGPELPQHRPRKIPRPLYLTEPDAPTA